MKTSVKDTAGKIAGNWSREQSNYADLRGTPDHHCGTNDPWWLFGGCKFYMVPNKCRKVSGYIALRGACDWFQPEGGTKNEMES